MSQLFSNIIVAFLAQIISIVLSISTSFFLPKVLEIDEFSYWQLYIFYISYIGIFHFGINDGVYLKYGGTSLNEIDKELISGQFKILCATEFIICSSIIFGLPKMNDSRTFVLKISCIYMFFFNTSLFAGYIFQTLNETKLYSYSVIIDKISFFILLNILYVSKNKSFKFYTISYLIGKIISSVYCYYYGGMVLFYKVRNWKRVGIETIDSIRTGVKLTVSSLSSMLIIGCGRMYIDKNFGVITFGKISFSLSLTSFVLAFISQISMVLFPYLRKIGETKALYLYRKISDILYFILPIFYFFYIPMKMFFTKWLPQYQDSMEYLSILFPICVFDAKMYLLYNTYFKVIRLENYLLIINIISATLSILSSIVSTYMLRSYLAIVISMVLVTIFRSVSSEYIIGRKNGLYNIVETIYSIIFTMIFYLSNLYFDEIYSLFSLLIFYCLYVILNRKKAKAVLSDLIMRIDNKQK